MATVVYLEDVPVQTKKESAAAAVKALDASGSDGEDVPAPKKPVLLGASSTNTTSTKRQRTLFDMMASDASAPKKQKTLAFAPAARFTAGSTTTSKSTSTTAMKRRPLPSQKLNSIPFSLSAFTASLPDDTTRALLALECDCMGKSWLKLLADEISQPYFLALKKFLYDEGVRGAGDAPPARIYPAPKNIYAWSDTPLGRIKVVILGQDPYISPGQAHGLSFSVPMGVGVPASLQNIYQQLRSEYPSFTPPRHGHLAGWAAQGVLLLNTVLTVRAGQSDSHAERGWETFTERVMQVVDRYGGAALARPGESAPGVGRGVVVMAWGAKAAKRVTGLDAGKHLILKSAHPSPKSADRGFFGNGHFKKANEWLEGRYGEGGGIDWGKL
ncbi:uracil-DNA glycosylase-like protein [Mycena metata]|uniref:Uracil-DNA glycosylase n=1 Tax=Mycena metata TaxID=1033252 RepID=A0AAD7IQA2_9AGAR|nr:uracil-DNA glycosylase-like protein [Mycena metata]